MANSTNQFRIIFTQKGLNLKGWFLSKYILF